MLSTAFLLAASMVVGQAEEKPSALPDLIAKELQFFVGSWTSEGTVQGMPMKGRLDVRWSSGGHCLVCDFRLRLEDERIQGNAVWGWDSASEELLWTAFYSNNVLEINRQQVKSPGMYRGTFSGSAFGKSYEAEGETDRRGPDEWTFSTKKHLSEGEPTEGINVRFTRAAKKAKESR